MSSAADGGAGAKATGPVADAQGVGPARPDDRTRPVVPCAVVALVVPSSPMQLPDYVGLQDPFGAIRERCVRALAEVLHERHADRVAIVTTADPAAGHTRGPLGVRIGRELLARAGWTGDVTPVAVPVDADGAAIAEVVHGIRGWGEGILLLVVADGSAKRTEKAPGHFDDRAAAVDADVLRALAEGDTAALAALDPGLCQELWLTGRAAFAVLAGVFSDVPADSSLLWSGDPYGVQYVLARWQASTPAPDDGQPAAR